MKAIAQLYDLGKNPVKETAWLMIFNNQIVFIGKITTRFAA